METWVFIVLGILLGIAALSFGIYYLLEHRSGRKHFSASGSNEGYEWWGPGEDPFKKQRRK
ncbi:MAG TPA: hypothetical protein VJI75_00165 [Candidatus Nanoarchaeia archaeon]|nr:hypothetical protein [Candidatus Nanoarchaeia archaeon]